MAVTHWTVEQRSMLRVILASVTTQTNGSVTYGVSAEALSLYQRALADPSITFNDAQEAEFNRLYDLINVDPLAVVEALLIFYAKEIGFRDQSSKEKMQVVKDLANQLERIRPVFAALSKFVALVSATDTKEQIEKKCNEGNFPNIAELNALILSAFPADYNELHGRHVPKDGPPLFAYYHILLIGTHDGAEIHAVFKKMEAEISKLQTDLQMAQTESSSAIERLNFAITAMKNFIDKFIELIREIISKI